MLIFFYIEFQRSKGGSTCFEINQNFKYVSSWVYSIIKYCKSGNKAVYNYKTIALLLQGVDKM